MRKMAGTSSRLSPEQKDGGRNEQERFSREYPGLALRVW